MLQPDILYWCFMSKFPYILDMQQNTCWEAACKNESLTFPTPSFVHLCSELLKCTALYQNESPLMFFLH